MNDEKKKVLIETYYNYLENGKYESAERLESVWKTSHNEILTEADIMPEDSGLKYQIWVDTIGSIRNKSDKSPRLKVKLINSDNSGTPFSIPTKKGERSRALVDLPKGEKIKGRDLNKIFKFIGKYNDVLLTFYYRKDYKYGYLYEDKIIEYYLSILAKTGNYSKATIDTFNFIKENQSEGKFLNIKLPQTPSEDMFVNPQFRNLRNNI